MSRFSKSDRDYQICTKTVMDTSDPDITFDENGVCHYYYLYEEMERQRYASIEERDRKFARYMQTLKDHGRKRSYDCIIGISGGVDSSYLLHLLVENGIKPLAVHFDSGWNSELAVSNIHGLVNETGVDLETVVCDWEEMRDLQLSFFKASVANCDIPQDHAFGAANMRIARREKLRYNISGHNIATESILPPAWGYSAADLRHIKDIQQKHGSVRLKKYPMRTWFDIWIYNRFIYTIHKVNLLDYVDYNKADAKALLAEKYGWRDYGGKHYESVFTKFFQAHYLPHKFGFDKRRAHLSSLIVSGQATREQALKELEEPLYDPAQLTQDKAYVAKKLGVSVDEFEAILAQPIRHYSEYKTQLGMLSFFSRMKRWVKKVGG